MKIKSAAKIHLLLFGDYKKCFKSYKKSFITMKNIGNERQFKCF